MCIKMDKFSREIETIRENQMKIIESENTMSDMKNSYHDLYRSLTIALERTSECQKLSKLKHNVKKNEKSQISEICVTVLCNVTYM
jgi:hypothetical protein